MSMDMTHMISLPSASVALVVTGEAAGYLVLTEPLLPNGEMLVLGRAHTDAVAHFMASLAFPVEAHTQEQQAMIKTADSLATSAPATGYLHTLADMPRIKPTGYSHVTETGEEVAGS